jgi:hypothetical protein
MGRVEARAKAGGGASRIQVVTFSPDSSQRWFEPAHPQRRLWPRFDAHRYADRGTCTTGARSANAVAPAGMGKPVSTK